MESYSYSRTGIIKVPLNTSKFLNFDNISLRSTTVLESVGKPSEAATHLPVVHGSGKNVKKVKGISWKDTQLPEKTDEEENKTSAKPVVTGTKCLTKSKEVPASSPIFDDLDWTKYLSSRAKSKLTELNTGASAVSKDSSSPPAAALTKSKISEDEFISDNETPEQQQQIPGNEDVIPEPELPSDLPLQQAITLHPTNPFFADGEGTFSLPLPLYREKLMEPDETTDNSYFLFQDGGECVNPFLDQAPESPVSETFNALFNVLQNDINVPLETTPEPTPDPVAAWNWTPLNPPNAPSIYFLTPHSHSLGFEASKAYRNRRTESDPTTFGPTSTPKFLAEVRASLSDISLVPAVSSVPSIPSSASGSRGESRDSSARSRSSDDQNADTEEVDGYVVPRHKNKKKFRKHKRNGVITATSLDSKIIEILTSYNRAANSGTSEQRNFLQRRCRPASCSLDRTQSVPVQKVNFRFPDRVPKDRASQNIEVKRKNSVNPESSYRPLVMPRGLPNVPKPKMQLQRNIVQENIIMAKYGCGNSTIWANRMGLDPDKLAQSSMTMLNRSKSNSDQASSVQKKSSVSKVAGSGIKKRDSNSRLSKNR